MWVCGKVKNCLVLIENPVSWIGALRKHGFVGGFGKALGGPCVLVWWSAGQSLQQCQAQGVRRAWTGNPTLRLCLSFGPPLCVGYRMSKTSQLELRCHLKRIHGTFFFSHQRHFKIKFLLWKQLGQICHTQPVSNSGTGSHYELLLSWKKPFYGFLAGGCTPWGLIPDPYFLWTISFSPVQKEPHFYMSQPRRLMV